MDCLTDFLHIVCQDTNRLVYTILIFMNHFAFGVSLNIVGVCLVDLGHIFGVSDTSLFPADLGVGYFFGALVGFLYRYIDRQLTLSILMSILAVITIFLTHFGKLWIVIVLMFFMGIGGGAWDSSQTSWTVELWPEYPSIALQTIQLLYGVGSIIAPLLAAPFLYGEKNVTSDNKTITLDDRIHSLSVPFAINGALQIFVPIILLILHFIYPYCKPFVEKKIDQTIVDVKKIPNRMSKLALGALCVGTYSGLEMSWFSFASTMLQHVGLKMEAKEAAHVLAILSTTYTIGKCLTAIGSKWILPDYIASAHFSVIIIAMNILYFGQDSRPMIYIGSAILGYGFSAVNAAIFAFSERHLKLTDRVCSIYAVNAGIFSLIVLGILSLTFTKYPQILFIIEGILLASCLTIFVAMKIWIMVDNGFRW